jgi:tRNA(Ile)-lysidine synthase/bifunctional protein TilS/HprT
MTVPWRNIKAEIKKTLNNYVNVFVMVSGGVDSMVLLDLVSRIRPDVKVIHFRHRIRANDYKDASLVINFAMERNLTVFLGFGSGLSDISNQEHEARIQRWQFVDEIIETLFFGTGRSVVLTAHHYDDNLEQYFMASMRGSQNLVMKKFTKTDLYDKYKPFLFVEKQDLINVAVSRNIPWVEDESNQSLDHERNILRQKIIPEMMKIRNIKKSMRPLIQHLVTQEV